MADVKPLPINAFDPRLMLRLDEDAVRAESSRNDVAVGILAPAFEVEFEGVGGSRRQPSGSTTLYLYLPARLYYKIEDRAVVLGRRAGRNVTKKEIVEQVLCEHYGIRYEPTVAKPRGRRSRRAAA